VKTQNIKIRKAKDRGHGNYGWLNTYHTFSFGEFHDPEHMGFRTLRVINDDTVKPGMGFEAHRHRDMEIITYVIDGALEHKDSAGNGSVITQGDFQKMTAGSGIEHSEFNPLKDRSTRLLQIWIKPDTVGLKPSYEELKIPARTEGLRLVACQNPGKGQMRIHQDIEIHFGRLKEYATIDITIDKGRGAWIQMIDGKIKFNDECVLNQGDGLAIEEGIQIKIVSLTDARFLLFNAA